MPLYHFSALNSERALNLLNHPTAKGIPTHASHAPKGGVLVGYVTWRIRTMSASLHRTNDNTRYWLIMNALIITSALLCLSSPMASNTAAAAPTDDRTAKPKAKQTGSILSTDTKPAITTPKKSHRLIRRPTSASTLQNPSVELTPVTPSTNSVTPSSPSPQENTSTQLKEASANKSVMPIALAAPLASPVVGQITSATAHTLSPLIGSAAPSRHTAAVDTGLSAQTPPASMRRLFSEIPGVAQIAAYEEPDPTITTPTIARNPSIMSFSAVQNGAAPATQALTISNNGPGTLTWTAASNSTWLTLNSATSISGSNLGSVNVGVNPSGLSVGAHSGAITIIGAGATNSPQTVTVTFDITAAPTPTIELSATSLSFSAIQGGSNPANRTITISNSGSGTLNWTASESATWLSVSPASGTGTGTVTVSTNISGMTAGSYSVPITIAATGATNAPQTVTVSLMVTAQAAIGFSPTSMGFTATQGGAAPASQALTISNTGGGTVSWTVSDDATWLTPSPTSGTGSGFSMINISTTGLAAGTYSATVTINASGATNTPRTIPVTLTITAAAMPTISRTPSALTFTATQGGANPANQTVTITNSGTGTLSWTASDNAAWLTVTPTSGTNSGAITTSVNASGLSAGTYAATITIASTGATNTPQTLAVSLTVSAATTSSATLTWTSNKETDLAGYKIYRGTASGSYGLIATVPAGTLTYQATGLALNTTYFFAISAYDTAGNESPYSSEVSKSIF